MRIFARHDIATRYSADKAGCRSMAGNAQDICIVEAKGREGVAMAELEMSHAPSDKHRYDVRMAKADGTYSLAKERCDDAAGNTKDVCLKQAKAAHVAAKADAKLAEKTADANATANDKTATARRDASVDKRDADYAVAREKCGAFAGDAKEACVGNAKTTFSQ